MKFEGIAAILPVRDVSAALNQYRALGFDGDAYDERDPEGRPFYAFLWRDDINLHLTLVPTLDPDSNTSSVYLYVDDPDALYKEWRAAAPSGQLREPHDTDWGMREMSYADSDGNLLRIGRRLKGAV